MICSIYSHSIGFDKIKLILNQKYPSENFKISVEDEFQIIEMTTKAGLFSKKNILKITYRERDNPSYKIPTIVACPFISNLKGLHGYVASLPSENEKVKNLFLEKIETLNSEFSIIQVKGETDGLADLIQHFSQIMDAVLFVQGDTIISQSTGQHFLDKNLNLILDNEGKCAVETMDIIINTAYYDAEELTLSEDQKNRKSKNETLLNELNIKVNKNLPCIESEEEVTIRETIEIAERVTVLTVTNAVAFNEISGQQALDFLEEKELYDFPTNKEMLFMHNPNEQNKGQETWKCECIWVLMWALGVVEKLEHPNKMAELSSISPEKYPINKNKNPLDFIKQATIVRSKSEILDANDLYYRMNWACVDARIKGEEMTMIIPGVVYERQYALNWLIHYKEQKWDEITCDT